MIHINLYRMTCEKIKVNKTTGITFVKAITGTFRSAVNVFSPVIVIQGDLLKFNYVYIEELHRYYFVSDVQIGTTETQIVYLREDVLMSFKNSINDLGAFIDRNENTYDSDLIDNRIVLKSGVNITTIEVDGSPFNPSDITLSNIVLETINDGRA